MPPIELVSQSTIDENVPFRCKTAYVKKPMRALPAFVNSKTFDKLVGDIDTFIFDADGVLWLGEGAIDGSPAFIAHLLTLGKQVIILTNNATKSRAVYAKKLATLGYPACLGKESIVNPSAVVADVLHRRGLHKTGKKCYLIGEQGLRDELDEVGVKWFGCGADPIENQEASKNTAFLYDIELEEDIDQVGAVVVGYEKHFNYNKLMKAANYLQDEAVDFIGTNEDETCPGPRPDIVIPDAGPLIAAIKTASGRDPLVVGKPYTPAYDYICRRWSIDPKRTLMIGDRTNTDVKFGRDHGLKSMLVLSGCHQLENVVENQLRERYDMVPDYYAKCLGALIPPRSADSTRISRVD